MNARPHLCGLGLALLLSLLMLCGQPLASESASASKLASTSELNSGAASSLSPSPREGHGAHGPLWTRWPVPASPVLAARHAAAAPVVDGRPDEAVWREAAWSTAFMDMVDGSPPWLRTEVALLWDDKALYVAVRMEEPWMEARIAERDGPVYRDPDFELFLAGKDAYWELEVNARNTVYDVFWIWRDALDAATAPKASATPAVSAAPHGFDPARWNAATRRVMLLSGIGEHRHPRGERVGFIDEDLHVLRVAVDASGTLNNNADTDKGWTVEMSIPWEALRDLDADMALPPSPGAVLPMNLSRFVSRDAQGAPLPPLRPAAWTLTRHGVFDSHVPERFARVVFTEGGQTGLSELPAKDELRAFLAAHLSAADRLVLGENAEAFLNKHADFVARVVAQAPWKDKLTPELVRAWLLPVRVTGEPLESGPEAWTEALRAELLPVLAASSSSPSSHSPTLSPSSGPAATLTEAALRVRQWLATRAVPGLSPPWSLGPLALLRAGAGRCEELGILFVNAARAVGIPARIAYAPAWRGADGNHLWVEFWDGAQWVALSPEQPDAPPGTGWFYPQLDKAAVVQTRGFGPNPAPAIATATSQPEERLLSAQGGIFTRNRTAAYTATGMLRVHSEPASNRAGTPDAAGTPVPSPQPVEARVYVFNGGRPRVVATGHGTDLSFALGTGSYLMSVARAGTEAGTSSLHTVTVREGATTEFFVVPPATPQESVVVDEAVGYAAPVSPHSPGPGAGIAQRPLPPPVASPVGEIAFADSLYADPELLRQEAEAAHTAWRTFWGARADSGELAALFAPYVLSGRVDDEPFSHWRGALSAVVREASVPGNAEATAQNVHSLLAERHPAEGSGLTTLVPLAALARLALAERVLLPLPDRIWADLCVAALRSLGIPARVGTSGLRPGMGGGVWVEYFDGKDWRFEPRANTGYAADEARRHYGAQGTFDAARRGLNPAEAFHTWSLCRVGRGGELFAVPLPFTEGGSLRVPVGDYILVSGQRPALGGALGLAQWRAEPVRVE